MLTVILKGTNACNLRCTYCSVGNKKNTKIASAGILIDIFNIIAGICKTRKENNLTIILHGGEPTLISPKQYETAFQHLHKTFPRLNFKIQMQTNGYEFSQEWIQLIKMWDIHIGISIDGPRDCHNNQRRDVQNQGTYDRVIENIKYLKSEDISVACLMVLTQKSIQYGFDYLKEWMNLDIPLKINPLLEYGEALNHPDLYLKQGDYADYLINLYEYLIHNQISMVVSPLDHLINSILCKENRMSCLSCPDCNSHFLSIDYNGNIYPCGKFSDMKEYCLGNIYDANINVDKGKTAILLKERRTLLRDGKCQKCKYLKYCNGGCTGEAAIVGNIMDPTPMCADYYRLFEYFESRGKVLLKDALVKRKKYLLSELNQLGL